MITDANLFRVPRSGSPKEAAGRQNQSKNYGSGKSKHRRLTFVQTVKAVQYEQVLRDYKAGRKGTAGVASSSVAPAPRRERAQPSDYLNTGNGVCLRSLLRVRSAISAGEHFLHF